MKVFWVVIFGCLFNAIVDAQESLPFASEMQAFKRQDSIAVPARGQILFLGSSSFTTWKDVQAYFPGYAILNRAFGGSTLADLIRYQEALIKPYAPRQIVIYCGENDFAESDTVSVETVVNRFKQLYGYIRIQHKNIPVVYVSMKPSPSRRHLLPKYLKANEAIRSYMAAQKYTRFVSVYDDMLLANGQPNPAIFKSDSLHMNAAGYAIWKRAIKPNLIK